METRFLSPEQVGESPVVLYMSPLMQKMGVDHTLIQDIKQHETAVAPLGGLYAPQMPSEAIINEASGRVIYHNLQEVYKYSVAIKGGGSLLLPNEHPTLTGYPGSSDSMFYDRKSPTPRIWGTESATWGALEMANALTVLRQRFPPGSEADLKDAFSQGCTIPVSLTYMPHLTRTMTQMRRESGLPQATWEGNDHLVRIGSLVPSTERVTPQEKFFAYDTEILSRASKPEIVCGVAQNIRKLLELGIIYSERSSHLQNFYYPSCTPADQSDFVFLGDFAPIERANLIYSMLFRRNIYNLIQESYSLPIVPAYFNHVTNHEPSDSAMRQALSIFYDELLSDIPLVPERMEYLPLISYFDSGNDRIEKKVVAQLLADKYAFSTSCEETANQRSFAVAQIENMLHENGIEAEVTEELIGKNARNLRESRIIDNINIVEQIIDFLRGGEVPPFMQMVRDQLQNLSPQQANRLLDSPRCGSAHVPQTLYRLIQGLST